MNALAGDAPLTRTTGLSQAGVGIAIQTLLLLGLALVVRVAWLEAAPHIDELYHLLAAEGWLATGDPRIAAGVYERASLFTALVGLSMQAFEPTLLAARLPALLAGLGLVVAIFIWVRSVAGSGAAWIAGLLMALSPLAVELSQLARFYTLHALVFWFAVIGLYHALDPATPRPGRLAAGLLALVAWPIALHLQVLTAVGALGVGLWFAGAWAPAALRQLRAPGRGRLLVGGALIVVLAALAFAIESGLLGRLIGELRSAPLWAREFQNQIHFYHLRLAQQYPVLWPLAGVAALAALAARPRAASLCLVIFGTAFAVGSLAGMKDDRYLFYVLPFLFTLWGIALASLAGGAARALGQLAERVRATFVPALPATPSGLALGGAVLAFAISAGAPMKLIFDLATAEQPAGTGRVSPDWWSAAPDLRAHADAASVVLVSNELAALGAFGRADVVISASRISDVPAASEYSRDARTGVVMISEAASLDRIVACTTDGIVILSERDLANAWAVPPATFAEVRRRATPLALAGAPGLQVFAWRHDEAPDQACPVPLPRIGRQGPDLVRGAPAAS